MLNLTTLKTDELKDIAREYSIAGAWKMAKANLIDAILKNAELNGHADRYCVDAPAEESTTEDTTTSTETEAEPTTSTETATEYDEAIDAIKAVEDAQAEVDALTTEETTEDAEEPTTEDEPDEIEEEREVTITITLTAKELTDEVAAKLDEIIEANDLFDNWEEVILKRRTKKTSKHINTITWNGKTQTIKEWAAELGMQWPALYDRINRNGWTIEEAMTIPVGGRRTKKTEG